MYCARIGTLFALNFLFYVLVKKNRLKPVVIGGVFLVFLFCRPNKLSWENSKRTRIEKRPPKYYTNTHFRLQKIQNCPVGESSSSTVCALCVSSFVSLRFSCLASSLFFFTSQCFRYTSFFERYRLRRKASKNIVFSFFRRRKIFFPSSARKARGEKLFLAPHFSFRLLERIIFGNVPPRSFSFSKLLKTKKALFFSPSKISEFEISKDNPKQSEKTWRFFFSTCKRVDASQFYYQFTKLLNVNFF